MPTFANEIRILRWKKDFNDVAWQLTGELTGFNGYFNRLAGYAHSGNTLTRVQALCASKGVRFLLGETVGKVEASYTTFAAAALASAQPTGAPMMPS